MASEASGQASISEIGRSQGRHPRVEENGVGACQEKSGEEMVPRGVKPVAYLSGLFQSHQVLSCGRGWVPGTK